MRTAGLLGVVCACVFAGRSVAGAQTLPSGPIAFADGHVTMAGDVSAAYGSEDPGFFNYTDYDHSALRLVRINVSGTVKANEHFALLADLQTENLDSVRPYALYVRIRPWTTRGLDIQIGLVPPTFGAFGRRLYASDNPLIGYPLGYQYLTSLRPDALPANADELLQKRGLGWLVRYSVGDPAFSHGVPLINGFRWDTGVQVHAESPDNLWSVTGSITAGTLSNPLFHDDNGGRQVAARVETRPVVGLVAGASFARGAFVQDDAARAALAEMHPPQFVQTAWGADVEYSRDHILVRAEAIATGWEVPPCTACEPARRVPAIDSPLRSTSLSAEGKYTLRPGLYAAARIGHLGFSDVTGTTATTPWDAPVMRLEVGGGYAIQRNLLAKVSYQHNQRDGGRLATSAHLVATQLVYWF
jgi:prepilin-type processing-associated H-X9-DG protein